MVNDYPMNLIQVRDSGHLRFQVPDVQTVFEVCRNIYRRDYEKLSEVYGDKEIDAELGVVIGTITESQGIVSQALESRGGRMNMCTALEELERKGMEKGMKTGKILARYEDGMSPEEIARKMGLAVEQVEKILEENGMLTTI